MKPHNSNVSSPVVKLLLIFASKKVVVASLVITCLLTLAVTRVDTLISGNGGTGQLYLFLSFSKPLFEMILASWGINGIDLYQRMSWLNFLYAIAYAILLSSAFAYFLIRQKENETSEISRTDITCFLIPYFAAFFDCTAHVLVIFMITQRFFQSWIIFGVSLATGIKWILLLLSLVLALRGYFRLKKQQ